MRWVGSALLFSAALYAASPPAHSGWQTASSASDWVDNAYWESLYQDPDATITVARGVLTATAGKNFLSGINIYAPQLKVSGDFGITATISVSSGGSAWLQLAGSLTTGPSYWNNQKYIAIGLNQGHVGIYWSDGTTPNPTGNQGWSAGPFSGPVNIELIRQGTQFSISVNQTLLGQVADIGIFSSGNVYPGLNVAPGSQLTVTGWAAETPQGPGNNVHVVVPAGPVGLLRRADSMGVHWAKLGRLFSANPFPQEVAAGENPAYSNPFFPTSAADPTMRQKIVSNWNSLTNFWFFYPLTEPVQGKFNVSGASFLTDFAEANRMPIIATTLISGHAGTNYNQLPAWLANGTFDRDQLINILQTHIQAVMTPFKGRVGTWEVVAEVLDGQGLPRNDSVWGKVIGFPDYIDIAFQTAHHVDPDAKLVFKEVGGENAGPLADGMYNLVQGMLARHVPIDGVGFESHFIVNGAHSYLPDVTQVEANMKRLADLGLFARIAELDVSVPLPPSPQDLITQTKAFTDMATACLASANCISVNMWNLNDADSWIPAAYPGFGSATLFDTNFEPKPAYFALQNLLELAEPPRRINHR